MLPRRTHPCKILVLVLSVLCVVAGSCATQRHAQKPQSATKDEPYRFETEGKIPPLTEADVVKEADFEEVPVSEEEVFAEDVEVPPMDTLQGRPPLEPVKEKIEGFRVQLFATGDEETAEAVRVAAERKLGLSVYTEWVEGLYKVRAGNCRNREEAEGLLKRCRSAGYGDAWIVKTLVFSNPGVR